MKISDKRLLRELTQIPESHILDWGCGDGKWIDKIKNSGCMWVSGLEVDPLYAREEVEIDTDTIGWLQSRGEAFDLIFARETIMYVDKELQKQLWSAFFHALKPGGRLYVQGFNGALITSQYPFQKDLGIKFVANEVLLRNLALEAGFEDIEIRGVIPNNRTPIGWLISTLSRMYTELNYRFRFFLERGIEQQNPKLFTKTVLLTGTKQRFQ
jgi:hypothetical protein